MATVRHPFYAGTLAPLLLGTALVAPAAAQQQIGVNSAVNPNATGIPPGAAPRRLVLGQDVVFNERITTTAEGQTQILFVDQSAMTVGPNSDMVIDQFVYDPNTGAGKLAANLTRGVFRFVGGKLSKQENAVTMTTPVATIGIRGGVILVNLAPNGSLDVIFGYGTAVTVTGINGIAQTITRPGFQVTVSGRGAVPSSPAPAPQGAAAALIAQLDGRPGGSGGAHTVPTESTVANSGIASVISGNLTASVQAANLTQPPAPQAPRTSTLIQRILHQPPARGKSAGSTAASTAAAASSTASSSSSTASSSTAPTATSAAASTAAASSTAAAGEDRLCGTCQDHLQCGRSDAARFHQPNWTRQDSLYRRYANLPGRNPRGRCLHREC